MTRPVEVSIPIDEGLWDSKDVERFLNVSRSWVYQHAADGTLPSVKIGGCRRYVPAQIRRYALGESAAVIPLPRKVV